jgi:hypothetical protein
MNEEVFNLDLRKFLKRFGVTAQREIERAVADAIRARRTHGSRRWSCERRSRSRT